MAEESMRKASIAMHGTPAGVLDEEIRGSRYVFRYLDGYDGPPVSLTMPLGTRTYTFETFPPVFDGLLPEGIQLEALLRHAKIDRNDFFSQLVVVGGDLVGAVTATELS
jgi:serine/threonine-protein kinase HipA